MNIILILYSILEGSFNVICLIENYGFVPLTKEEARSIGMPNSIGDFSELFYKMEDDIETGKNQLVLPTLK